MLCFGVLANVLFAQGAMAKSFTLVVDGDSSLQPILVANGQEALRLAGMSSNTVDKDADVNILIQCIKNVTAYKPIWSYCWHLKPRPKAASGRLF
jgi:hypothetical protein